MENRFAGALALLVVLFGVSSSQIVQPSLISDSDWFDYGSMHRHMDHVLDSVFSGVYDLGMMPDSHITSYRTPGCQPKPIHPNPQINCGYCRDHSIDYTKHKLQEEEQERQAKILKLREVQASQQAEYDRVSRQRWEEIRELEAESEKAKLQREESHLKLEEQKQANLLRQQKQAELQQQRRREAEQQQREHNSREAERRGREDLRRRSQHEWEERRRQEKAREEQTRKVREQERRQTNANSGRHLERLVEHKAPGYYPDELAVQIKDGRVLISGNHICTCAEDCITKEFRRSYALPPHIEPSTVRASIGQRGWITLSGLRGPHQTRPSDITNVEVVGEGVPNKPSLEELRYCLKNKGGMKLNKVDRRTGQTVASPDEKIKTGTFGTELRSEMRSVDDDEFSTIEVEY